jgi:excisionase family DNA binding protein
MANRTSGILDRLERIEAKLDGLLGQEVMTAEEAAAFLDISISYIYKLTSRRKIPYYKPEGKRLYFKRSELAEWALSNKILTDEEIEAQTDAWLAKTRSGLRTKLRSRNIGK